MKKISHLLLVLLVLLAVPGCVKKGGEEKDTSFISITKEKLKDKIKGAWAAQTIGVTYGGPTEFRYKKVIIDDSIQIAWSDTTLFHTMTTSPGLYDDIYMDLTFVEVLEKEGLDAPALAHARAYATARYWLWHANQQGRYNVLHGLSPPQSGHWINNPHADDIDFQIESDFIGIMNPGMPNSALELCDKVGHIMNSGDGYYGGVFVAGMYANAFIYDNVPVIVNRALELVPEESTFYQCIYDVIEWYNSFPGDWKKTWQLTEEKWGEDIGCPDGAFRDFNIDAKINAAYVVIGLLYGEGDFGNTIEIATRCGQDSDCNPATAGAIIGTVLGYDKIPEYWSSGLAAIEDMDFLHTNTSLSEVYDISFDHALQSIEKNGGIITDTEVKIKPQTARAAPLEQNFEGYALASNIQLNKKITFKDKQEYEIDFEGIGVVLRGRAWNVDFQEKYALESAAETLNDYVLKVHFYIDGKPSKVMELPLNFVERSHEPFFQYELPPGKHVLKFEIINPHEKVYLELRNMITYKKTENKI